MAALLPHERVISTCGVGVLTVASNSIAVERQLLLEHISFLGIW